MVKMIDSDLYDWVEYHTRQLENSAIGYPNNSTVGRMIEYGSVGIDSNYGPRVPLLRNAPPHVKRLAQMLAVLPDELLAIVRMFCIWLNSPLFHLGLHDLFL